ncbi:PAS domain-containing protein [Sphingomonas panacisoli]|uniref:histidine kinase n=1 Tax=Sphingomonas panacisoli TaxID=1813879 RepID=A0A5B8LIU0_9SPHN|nr:PAS domain-containing sensor histidine kinase [Sphingomonas panacisoli]QDZ08093.1 PAS domain-containing protein [Sphingomonas panacisoli]
MSDSGASSDESVEAAVDFEDLFESAPCGYLSTDKDGRIIRANKTFASWTGFTTETLARKRLSDLLTVGGRIFYETHFAPMLHIQGSFSEVALDILTSQGRKIPVIVNAVERRDSAGRPAFIRFTLFIAADRRTYELGLLESRDAAQATVVAERADSELREQFIAVLGHDLRNPLAAIASGVRILEREKLSERARRVLSLMDGSVVRAAGLIDNVLDFARGRLGGGITLLRDADEPLEPILRQVVAELRAIAPTQVVDAQYNIDEPVNCDRVRIGQLLSNLVGNALTHGAKDQPVRIEATTTPETLVIMVANGGAPIPAEARPRLFHPFERGDDRIQHQGLGLGLHIASEIAKAHHGTLTVTSDETETRFTFAMPLKVSPI